MIEGGPLLNCVKVRNGATVEGHFFDQLTGKYDGSGSGSSEASCDAIAERREFNSQLLFSLESIRSERNFLVSEPSGIVCPDAIRLTTASGYMPGQSVVNVGGPSNIYAYCVGIGSDLIDSCC